MSNESERPSVSRLNACWSGDVKRRYNFLNNSRISRTGRKAFSLDDMVGGVKGLNDPALAGLCTSRKFTINILRRC